MIKIGLTGGICAGKTNILSIFREIGCYTIRADEIAKSIIFSNKPGIGSEIIKIFGDSVSNKKNGIDKDAFTRMMFDDIEKRNLLNQFIHPLVAAERKNIIQDLEKSNIYNFFVYESALLVESGIAREFDIVIVVYTSEEEQINRIMTRDNLTQEEALKRIKAQFPLSEKLKVAHYAIDTSGTFEQSRSKTLETFHLIKKDFNLP